MDEELYRRRADVLDAVGTGASRSVLAGAIYIPPLKEMIFAVKGRGAWWS